MKVKVILSLLMFLTIASFVSAKVTASADTVYITGGTLSGGENAGVLESTINADTTATGARVNPNRVYALNEGQVYYQLAPINVYNPTGTLIIVGVPSTYGTTKPIILIQPTNGTDVIINAGAANQVYGSLKFVNIHYQTMQTDGYLNNELFYCGTANKLAQSLTIDNCLFEFSNIDLFDCTNESGAIGGWPNGAKFRITNTYFRNLFQAGQWWGCRVFQCKHPIDTLWVENCTVTTGGLTFLQQNELTDFAYFNHNTIVNNKKYWILSPYYKNLIITNNIFINQDWVGEDSNVTNSGQDPDKLFESTINVDTINATNSVIVQQKYYNGDSTHYVADLDLNKLKVYISNNINYYDPLLISGYYQSSTFTMKLANGSTGIPSYLTWSFPASGAPYQINNIPGAWMNSRTLNLFATYSPAKGGGFVEENTLTSDPQTVTPAIADVSVAVAMGGWNQNQWGDSRFSTAPILTNTKYIYGDYDPTTLPGKISGAKSDAVTGEGSGIQVGITKFTDLTEDFSQTAHLSTIDNLPIGSLIWNDAQLAAFSSTADLAKVNAGYVAKGGTALVTGIKNVNNLPGSYSLSQNYPNPFNPTTNIKFTLQKASNVTLAIYNVLGQKVSTLVSSFMREGSYSFQFDGSKLASGVYFYRIDAGSFNSVKKMILMK